VNLKLPKCDFVIVVGTPSYLQKYEDNDLAQGRIVAAEAALIHQRIMQGGSKKYNVLPLLLSGEPEESFTPLVLTTTYSDFRQEDKYLVGLFNLIVTMYRLDRSDPDVSEVQRAIQGDELKYSA